MKTVLRPYSITIDSVKPGKPPLVSIKLQQLTMADGEIKSISGSENAIYKNAEDCLAQTLEFKDPVTGIEGQISVAGVAQVVTKLAVQWSQEKLNSQIDPETGWLLD